MARNTANPSVGTRMAKKEQESEWMNGKKHGKNTWWSQNGQKEGESEYRDGKLHGKWVLLYENGQKKYEFEYHDGKRISKKCWDENGNPKPCK